MNEYTEVSRLAITDIPKFILAAFVLSHLNCSLRKMIRWQKPLRKSCGFYRDIDTNIEELRHEKVPTTNGTQLFDKNVATDSSLSPVDKAVYSVLCVLADNEALQCSPKVETIAAKASCSPRAVQTSLNTLEKRGLIRRKHRFINYRQISSLYTVIGSQAASCSVNISSREQKNNMCQ